MRIGKFVFKMLDKKNNLRQKSCDKRRSTENRRKYENRANGINLSVALLMSEYSRYELELLR
jgi:hypothetical protein